MGPLNTHQNLLARHVESQVMWSNMWEHRTIHLPAMPCLCKLYVHVWTVLEDPLSNLMKWYLNSAEAILVIGGHSTTVHTRLWYMEFQLAVDPGNCLTSVHNREYGHGRCDPRQRCIASKLNTMSELWNIIMHPDGIAIKAQYHVFTKLFASWGCYLGHVWFSM